MSTTDEVKADLEAICAALAQGQRVDAEVVERARQRSAELRRRFDNELSVELIRSIRDE
ncbi:MAG TPA: hypothetical protein VIK18_20545 [Pirellulales bacterium]